MTPSWTPSPRGRARPARALTPFLLLPLFALLIVSPTLAAFLRGLPAAWSYTHAPGCDGDAPTSDSPCRVTPLTVTRKWQVQTGRHSDDNFVRLQAADGTAYDVQIRDGGFWTQLGQTRRVTAQVWREGGQGKVMWLRDGASEAQTEDHPAHRGRNAGYALAFVAIVALIAAVRGAVRR